MKIDMTLDRARQIVKDVVAARKKWGRQADLPYTLEQLMDALMLVHDAGNLDAPSAEDITKLKRQLAACMNREKSRTKKYGDTEGTYAELTNETDPAGAAFRDPAVRAEIENKLLGIGEEKQD